MEGERRAMAEWRAHCAQPPNAAWLSGRATRFLNRCASSIRAGGTLQKIDLEAGLALLTA